MDEAFVIHGIRDGVEPRFGDLVVDVRMEQAPFVELAGDAHGAERVQVAWPAAVDLQTHAMGFAETHRLHQRREAAQIADAGAADVGGATDNPLGTRVHLALGRLRSHHGQVELLGQPDVGRDAVLGHGFLHPVVVELLQLATQIERLFPVVVVEGVEHKGHVGADGLAHGRAGGNVAFGIGCAGHGRLPGVQLEGRIASLHGPERKLGVGLRRVQPAGDIVAAHGAGVGRDLVTRCAQQFVDRQVGVLAGQIPECQVDGAEHLVGQLSQMQPLAFLEHLPEVLAIEGVLADEQRLDQTLDHIRAAAECIAGQPLVGDDGDHGLDRVVFRARVAMALGVANGVGAIVDFARDDVDDLHGFSLDFGDVSLFYSLVAIIGSSCGGCRPMAASASRMLIIRDRLSWS